MKLFDSDDEDAVGTLLLGERKRRNCLIRTKSWITRRLETGIYHLPVADLWTDDSVSSPTFNLWIGHHS